MNTIFILIKKFISKFIDIFLEIIYPKKCIICNDIIDFNKNNWFCSKCINKLKPIKGNICEICGISIDMNNICSSCRNADKRYFEKAFCMYEYNDNVKFAIYNIKFYDKPQNIRYFIEQSYGWLKDRCDFCEIDFIVAVPMTANDKNKRGYNQSEIFAKGLAKKLNVKFLPVLKKVKRTKPQHTLTANERKKNLKNVFSVNDKYKDLIKNKTILVVDDVFTTGTTVNECSKVLKNAGVKKVYVHCIAIVKPDNRK